MNKCVVFRLLEEVNNDSLRKLGELRLVVNKLDAPNYGAGSSGTQRFTIISSQVQTLKCLNGGSFTDGSGTPTAQSQGLSANVSAVLVVYNNNYEIQVPNKYALKTLTLAASGGADVSALSVNLDELTGCNELTSIRSINENTMGNISSLSLLPALTTLQILNSAVEGDIKDVPTSCTDISFADSHAVSGDIKSLGSHTSITSLLLYRTQVIGSVEEFAGAQIAAGRTSGSVYLGTVGTGITYNGDVLNSNVTITFSGGSYSVH